MRRATRPAKGPGGETLVGRNAILEVLRARRRKIRRLRVAKGAREAGALAEILELAARQAIPVVRVERAELEGTGGKSHGVGAEVDPYPYVALEDILGEAEIRGVPPFLLMLDVLQDPQNVGTVLRTAEAVGVSGVVLPLGRAVGVTPAVVSASAGASEHLLIAAENLATAIDRLRDYGVKVVGLEAGAESQPLDRVALDGPLALVVGSEGKGLRRLVRERCDVLASLPMSGRIASLNAAVAGSIALYLAGIARIDRAAGAGDNSGR